MDPPQYSETDNLISQEPLNYKNNDSWAAVLFVLNLGFFFSVSYFYGSFEELSVSVPLAPIVSLFSIAALSSLFSYLLLALFTSQFVYAAFVLNIVSGCLVFLFALFSGNLILSFLFGIYLIASFYLFNLYWSRIPFTTLLLKSVLEIITLYPSTILLSLVSLLLQIGWMCATLFAIYTVTILAKVQSDDQQGWVIGVSIYILFTFTWTQQTVRNLVHTSISGLFATFYFNGHLQNNQVVLQVSNPLLKSIKRTMTTSFGSVALGSLIIAVVDTLRVILHLLRRGAEERNEAMQLVYACFECLIGVIESYIEFCNVYAFTEVAIYGKSYFEAARGTWDLIVTNGINLIINDDLSNLVLNLVSLMIGLLTGLLYWLVFPMLSEIKADGLLVFGVGFFIGLIVASVVGIAVSSGIASTFVCLAKRPDSIREMKGKLYEGFEEGWRAAGVFSRV